MLLRRRHPRRLLWPDIGAAERDGRIGRVPHDPALPAHTAWDLGFADATAI